MVCVPPTFLIGGGSPYRDDLPVRDPLPPSGQRPTPWTDTPPGTWTRDRDPPKGTWDEVARQEVTSYRDATVHIIRRLNQTQNELKIKSAFVTSDTATSCTYLWQIEILRKT